jgi:proteic killer suppression protein
MNTEVITSFADRGTADIHDGVDSKAARKTLTTSLWSVARRTLDMVHAATSLLDLRAPPSNHLEKLRADRAGHHSIRVNDQYRIVFKFEGGSASDVAIVDYH